MEKMLEIIIRVLSGEALPSERQLLIKWLEEDPANAEILRQSETIWNAIEIINKSKEYDHEKAFVRFKEEVMSKIIASRKVGMRKTIDNIIRIAAIVVIVFGSGYFIIMGNKKPIPLEITKCEIISPRGSKTQVVLPDNTKVWLNSESRLEYNNSYNKSTREVFLIGEGYFEVDSNPEKTFIVNTSDLRVVATGTKFNVKSYPGENTIETTLIEGRVDIENLTTGKTSSLATLEPNHKITYFKDRAQMEGKTTEKDNIRSDASAGTTIDLKRIISNENVDPELVTSWKNNMIFFDNESFQDLAIKLERRFDVQIYFVDEDLKSLQFTGKFSDIIIEQVLAALQFASPFYFQLNDKDIYISEKPLPRSRYQNTPNN